MEGKALEDDNFCYHFLSFFYFMSCWLWVLNCDLMHQLLCLYFFSYLAFYPCQRTLRIGEISVRVYFWKKIGLISILRWVLLHTIIKDGKRPLRPPSPTTNPSSQCSLTMSFNATKTHHSLVFYQAKKKTKPKMYGLCIYIIFYPFQLT